MVKKARTNRSYLAAAAVYLDIASISIYSLIELVFFSCRIGNIAFFAAFVAPVVFVILINTITFSLIMYKLATRPPNAADPNGGNEGLLKIKRAFGILILVGITWMFGFFAVADARLVFHYMFAVCNSLQGFAIFIFYCVIQKKVRECWWALLTCNLSSLQKSKSLYTDSYDRRRLSSASRVQLDAMRARSNTGISQVSDKFCCCRYPTSFRRIARDKRHLGRFPFDEIFENFGWESNGTGSFPEKIFENLGQPFQCSRKVETDRE